MTTQYTFSGARSAAILGLAVAVMAGGSFATPVLTGAGEEAAAVTKRDDRRVDFLPRAGNRAADFELKFSPPTSEFGGSRVDELAPGRRLGTDHAPLARPNASSGPSGRDDSIPPKQPLRELVNVNGDPAGAPPAARERLRGDGAPDSRPRETESRPGDGTARDAVVSAPDKGMANFSLPGFGDVSLALSANRRSLLVNGFELPLRGLFDTENQKPSLERPDDRTVGTATTFARPPAIPEGDRLADNPRQLMGMVLEFLTDPVTILVVLGWLSLWLFSEIVQSVRQRRQRHQRKRLRRRLRRRATAVAP